MRPESPRSQAARIWALPTRAEKDAAIAVVEPADYQGQVKTHLNIWLAWRLYQRKVRAREAGQ